VVESVRVDELFVERRGERREAGASCGVATGNQHEPSPGSVTLGPREVHR
jgi:hypothetical protein